MLHEDMIYRKPASKYLGKWRLSSFESPYSSSEHSLFIQARRENTNSVHFLVWRPGDPDSVNPSFKRPHLTDEFHQWTANYGGELIPQPDIKILRNLIKSLFIEHTYRFVKD